MFFSLKKQDSDTYDANVCVVGTAYALLLYLLHLGDEDLFSTRYIFQDTIPQSVWAQFRHAIIVPSTRRRGMSKFRVLYRCVLIGAYLMFIRLACRNGSKYYVQDNLFSAPFIVGYRSYYLLSDGPLAYSVNEEMYRNVANHWKSSCVRRFIRSLFRIPTYGLSAGQNSQCRGVIEGEIDHSPLLCHKDSILVDFNTAWRALSDKRKQLLLSIFGLDIRLLQSATAKDVILITQPFATDGDVSEADLIAIYSRALANIESSRLVIKPHPRDDVDYAISFPDATVLPKFVPFQLVSALGFRFRKAVTISSSAISDMKDAEIIWIGNEVDKRIVQRYGTQRAVYERILSQRT